MTTRSFTRRELAKVIDFTLLKPDATAGDIEALCSQAISYGFLNVCVNPCWIELARRHLAGTEVGVCTVIALPLGATTSKVKAFEAAEAVSLGASELDMVMNVGAFKSRNRDLVLKDIRGVVESSSSSGRAVVKVIIETGLLTPNEKIEACRIVEEAGADFVKTCTGFGTGRATTGDVRLLRSTLSSRVGVKASGGVRTYEDAVAMLQAGANRIGASAGVQILQQAKED